MYRNNIHVSFPYIDVPGVFHCSCHVINLLSFKTVQLSLKVDDLGLQLPLLELQKMSILSHQRLL